MRDGAMGRRPAWGIAAAILVAAGTATAATRSTSDSISGTATLYDPSTDYSPSTANGGYHPPAQLGGYNGLLTLTGFNPAWGTLNSVTITTTTSLTLSLKAVENDGSPTSTINLYGYVDGQSPYGGFGNGYYASWTQSVAPGTAFTTPPVYQTQTGSYTNAFPSTFTPFYAPLIYVPVLAWTNGNGIYGASFYNSTDADGPFTYRMTFTYDYTPSTAGIPEPGSWGLLIVGFAGLGVVFRRRAAAPPSEVPA